MYTRSDTILDAVTATTTLPVAGLAIGDKSKMSLHLIATSVTSGNGVFRVKVSNTGGKDDWVSYNRLNDNLTNTNGQFDTRVQTVTLSANGTKIYFFPDGDHFKYLQVGVTRTTDGTYSAVLHSVGE